MLLLGRFQLRGQARGRDELHPLAQPA